MTLRSLSCGSRRSCLPGLGACAAAVLAVSIVPTSAAWAQAQGAMRATSVSASVDANVSQVVDRRAATGDASDTVTQLRPGFRVDSRSGRVIGSLAYSLNLAHHTKASYDGENVQNYLSGSLQAEAIERWMYVDAQASITQQPASAFGRQTVADSSVDNANRIEVGSLTVSPYVRGVLGSAVNYEMRLTGAVTNGRRSIAADSSTTGGSLSLSSAIPGTWLGWDLSANTQTVDFRAGRQTQTDRVQARLSFMPDPDLTLNLRGGQESTDVASVIKTRYDNWGAGLTWRPSPRTRAQFEMDERYFGRSHQVVLDHRMASSSIQFTSTRDARNGADPSAAGQRVTLYEVLNRLLATAYPDAVERDTQIRAILQGANNADPNQLVSTGSINSAITLTERNQLTLSYAGQRMTVTAQVYSSRNQVVDVAAAAAEPDRQWGYIGTASYRLTPSALLTLNGSRLLTQGSATRPGSELKSLSLGWSDQLGRRTSAGVTLRYSVFNGGADPYRQAAVTAFIGQRF